MGTPSPMSQRLLSQRLASMRAARTGLDGATREDVSLITPQEVAVLAADGAAVRGEPEIGALRSLMVSLIDVAAALARPAISGFRVGAVGRFEGGGMVLGGNLEFPGASIHHTIHAEGFVALRSRAIGEAVTELALSSASPCAHCRQVLAEFQWADAVRVIDPDGHDRSLLDLYPWPFLPRALGMAGVELPGATAPAATSNPAASRDAGQEPPSSPMRDTTLGDAGGGTGPMVPADFAQALRNVGRLAHAPYSGSVAAVALRLADGRLVGGACLESVAFNPTIGPLQDALVSLVALGGDPSSVEEAWLAVRRDAAVDHSHPTRDLLAAIAPAAELHVTYWD